MRGALYWPVPLLRFIESTEVSIVEADPEETASPVGLEVAPEVPASTPPTGQLVTMRIKKSRRTGNLLQIQVCWVGGHAGEH